MNIRTITRFIVICLLVTSCKPTIADLQESAAAAQNDKAYAAAIELYNNIIAKNNNIQTAYYNRGLCYLELKDYHKALTDFNEIIASHAGERMLTIVWNKNFPGATDEEKGYVDSYAALYMRAQVKYFMDSAAASYHDFQSCINNGYEASKCKLWQGSILLDAGKKDQACEYFEKAWRMATNDNDRFAADDMQKKYCGE